MSNETSISTQCTVATMNYLQLPSGGGGARQSEAAPNMGKMRNFEQISRSESRRSGSSSDDVMVIESPSAEKQLCPLVGTAGSLRTAGQEEDVRRSSRNNHPHQCCDSTVHSPQLSHQCTGASGTHARAMQGGAVGGWSDQCLGLESSMAVLSSPARSHTSGSIKQSTADQVGGRVSSSSAVSMLQQQRVGQEKDGRRRFEDCSPIQRACYELSSDLQHIDETSNQVGRRGSSLMVSKQDSTGGSDVVCILSDGEDSCSYVNTTSVYFEPKKKTESLEHSDQLECSIVSQQSCSPSSGSTGVPLSDSLVRGRLRSSSTGHTVTASQSTHGNHRPPLLDTPTSSGPSEAPKQSSISTRVLTSVPSAGVHGSHASTNQRNTNRLVDSHESCSDLGSPLPDLSPLPPRTTGEGVSAVRGTRTGKGPSVDLLPSEEDVPLVVVRDGGTDSDDDFEKPKKKHRNRFAISESSRREKPMVFSQQSRATPSDTPSHPPRKEGSTLEASPRQNMRSKPEECSVFDSLSRGNQRGNSSPLPPPPLVSSPRLVSQRKRSTSEDEVQYVCTVVVDMFTCTCTNTVVHRSIL